MASNINELERMWKEEVVAYSEVLSSYLRKKAGFRAKI
jgi:hypothetical protein